MGWDLGLVPCYFYLQIVMETKELWKQAEEINNNLNQWVRQKDLMAQRRLYYFTILQAYKLEKNTDMIKLYQYILQHHDMRTRVESYQMDYYKTQALK